MAFVLWRKSSCSSSSWLAAGAAGRYLARSNASRGRKKLKDMFQQSRLEKSLQFHFYKHQVVKSCPLHSVGGRTDDGLPYQEALETQQSGECMLSVWVTCLRLIRSEVQ